MSSIKISELTEVTQLNSNTAKNLVITVDLVTGTTNKMTVRNLAANLYSNNNLVVSQTITSNSNTSGSLVVYGGAGVTGNVYTGGVISPGKGLVFLPLVYPGAQTAITLDFANNSLVRANAASGVVASLSNLMAGKTVDLWITNTSGGTIVFTHGCSSLGSTVGATTYTIPATSSICASYVSFGTDVANTFVAITK